MHKDTDTRIDRQTKIKRKTLMKTVGTHKHSHCVYMAEECLKHLE